MKKSTKIIRLSVTLLLLIAMLLTPMSPIFAVVIENGDADLTAADIVSEDASKREKFSRHYLTGDGTYFAVSYAEQVNYQDDDGNWIAVDNSLSTNVLTGEKSTKNEKFKVKFANKANKEDLVTIKTSEYDVSFGITVSEDGESYLELNKVKGTESTSNTSAEPKTTQEATSLGKAVSGITYVDAFSDYLDVRYSVAHEKVKEDLILERKSSFNSYKVTYNIKEKDALATLNNDGSITFTSPDGAVLFNVGVPVMYDSDGKSSADIAVSMVQTKKTVEVTYTPSADWLNDEERVYPVTIDPTTQSGTYDGNYYETLITYGDPTYETVPSGSNSIITLNPNQGYYLYILDVPTLVTGMNFISADIVTYLQQWETNNSIDSIIVKHIGSYWSPGEVVYPDGSTAFPLRYNSFSIPCEDAFGSETPINLNLNLSNISSTDEYNEYFSSNMYYGFEITVSNNSITLYSSVFDNYSYRPSIIVRYTVSSGIVSSGGEYYIKNLATNKYLEANRNDDGTFKNGASLSLKNRSIGNQFQIFEITYQALNGVYRIKSTAQASDYLSKYLRTEIVNSQYFTEETVSLGHVVFDWAFSSCGNGRFSIHATQNPDVVLSFNSMNTIVATDYIQDSSEQMWQFIHKDDIVTYSNKAILVSVDDHQGENYASHVNAVSNILSNNGYDVPPPYTSSWHTVDDVKSYLSDAEVMIISAHGDNDSIMINRNVTSGFHMDDIVNMDLSTIKLLVILSCSSAATGTPEIVTKEDILNSGGPDTIFEQFVCSDVQTVVAFNAPINYAQSHYYVIDLFELLYSDTQSYTVAEAINVLKSNDYDVYCNYNPDVEDSVVIGGNASQRMSE